MRLSPSGNVGIGTTSPTQKLEVAGNVKISGPGNALIFPDSTMQTSAAADPSIFARLSGGNSFTRNPSVNWRGTAPSLTGNGSSLSAVDPATLGGQTRNAFARLNGTNNLT